MVREFISDTLRFRGSDKVGPPGEPNIVLQIRLLCDIGVLCAKNIRDGISDAEMRQKEQQRYQEKKFEAIQLARKLTDNFYRDTALRDIIELCMQAGDRNDAKTLLDAIQTDEIKTNTVELFPELFPVS
jgi:hypothetical protein